jgi:carbamoyltransferase
MKVAIFIVSCIVATALCIDAYFIYLHFFDNIWIQPAAGDAGGAIGAALGAYYLQTKKERKVASNLDAMKGSYLGPQYSQDEIEARLSAIGAVYETVSDEQLIDRVAHALEQGKAIGWHQGRMEFGPRALGGRSILADPRSALVQKQLNLKVKYRESFRPFAPSVLRENVSQWFDIDADSPYMLMVANVHNDQQIAMTQEQEALFGIEKLNVPRSTIPAVTHVDYSARVQTVYQQTNPRYYDLLSKFKELTGCPILVNTSFNVRGEPIVESPEDAFRCLMGTEIELLAVGNCILRKENQDQALIQDYKNKYLLD